MEGGEWEYIHRVIEMCSNLRAYQVKMIFILICMYVYITSRYSQNGYNNNNNNNKYWQDVEKMKLSCPADKNINSYSHY